MDDENVQRCYFCFEPSEKIVCDSPRCQQEDAEYAAEQKDAEMKMLKKGIRNALIERSKCEDDYYINRAQRWFYAFKCIVCVLLRRSRPASAGNYPDVVKVSTIFFDGYWPSNWSAAWLQVGHGIFRQWWYDILEDGEFIW